MRNLLLTLAFHGGAYHGWQTQNNAVTVQATLGQALQAITGETPPLTGCSRTDAGVHAAVFCCNVQTRSALPCHKVVDALNAHLPRDIVVLSCDEMPLAFHARYDCRGKTYCYRIWNSRARNVFAQAQMLQYPYDLPQEVLHMAAQHYVGTHDFAAFCAAGSSVKTTVRTVSACSVTRHGQEVRFTVTADGFLYNMVRIMVGTLLEIAQKKREAGSIPLLFEQGRRDLAGFTAQAEGLFLQAVQYDHATYHGWLLPGNTQPF